MDGPPAAIDAAANLGIGGSGSPVAWIGFTLFVFAMLALDLGVFHKKDHAVSTREALAWSVAWISLALVFCAGVWIWDGPQQGMEFLTGYLVEKSLSVDNLFVFLVTLQFFKVAPSLQHRVLFWGVLGALVLRAVFIFLGSALLNNFHWVMYVFGGFLVFTGFRLGFKKDDDIHPENNPVLKLFRRVIPAVKDYREGHFFVRENGRLLATPLLFVLVVVEATDVMFAVDSVPAVFAVTTDTFVVYTSNIFAILGLRSLYFLLAGYLNRFSYLNYGLAGVLVFVGIKMLLVDVYKVPIPISLGVITLLIGGSIVVSLLKTAKER